MAWLFVLANSCKLMIKYVSSYARDLKYFHVLSRLSHRAPLAWSRAEFREYAGTHKGNGGEGELLRFTIRERRFDIPNPGK